MSIRGDTLRTNLDRLLARCDPPALDPQGLADELDALVRAVDRHAPMSGYEGWWSLFEDALTEGMRGRRWPQVGDMARAAGKVPLPQANPTAPTMHWREHSAQRQLRAWIDGISPSVPPQFITRQRLEAIGCAPDQVYRALNAREASGYQGTPITPWWGAA